MGHDEAETEMELLSNQSGNHDESGFIVHFSCWNHRVRSVQINSSSQHRFANVAGCETETSPEPVADYSSSMKSSIQSVQVTFKVPKQI